MTAFVLIALFESGFDRMVNKFINSYPNLSYYCLFNQGVTESLKWFWNFLEIFAADFLNKFDGGEILFFLLKHATFHMTVWKKITAALK